MTQQVAAATILSLHAKLRYLWIGLLKELDRRAEQEAAGCQGMCCHQDEHTPWLVVFRGGMLGIWYGGPVTNAFLSWF